MKAVTPAERAAVNAFVRYGGVKQAAHRLGKSPHTIERQLESARGRLGVSTSAQAYREITGIYGETE